MCYIYHLLLFQKNIKQKNAQYFLKANLYITTNVFILKDPNPKHKVSIMDFYDYWKEIQRWDSPRNADKFVDED